MMLKLSSWARLAPPRPDEMNTQVISPSPDRMEGNGADEWGSMENARPPQEGIMVPGTCLQGDPNCQATEPMRLREGQQPVQQDMPPPAR